MHDQGGGVNILLPSSVGSSMKAASNLTIGVTGKSRKRRRMYRSPRKYSPLLAYARLPLNSSQSHVKWSDGTRLKLFVVSTARCRSLQLVSGDPGSRVSASPLSIGTETRTNVSHVDVTSHSRCREGLAPTVRAKTKKRVTSGDIRQAPYASRL